MNVDWDPHQFLIPWTSWIPYRMQAYPLWIPWNKFNSMVIMLEFQRINHIWLPKIVATSRIKHWALQLIMWFIDRALLPLHYVAIERHENKLNKICYSLATCKLSVSKPKCSICHHQQIVFGGPVHWTEKLTETELNPTAKDQTTSCSCTDSEKFQSPVVRFVKKLKDQKPVLCPVMCWTLLMHIFT